MTTPPAPRATTEAVLPGATGPDATLVVVTANNLSDVLAPLAAAVGLEVVVVDHADGPTPATLSALGLGPRHAVVLTDHDAPDTPEVVRLLLASSVGYVGQMGSRKRAAATYDALRAEGVSEDALTRLHVPVGLDIGGRSAGEIALSVVAEVVAWANGKLVRVGDRSGLAGA